VPATEAPAQASDPAGAPTEATPPVAVPVDIAPAGSSPAATAPLDDPPVDPLEGVEVVVTAYERIRLRSEVADTYRGDRGNQVDGARFAAGDLIRSDPSTGTRRLVLDIGIAVDGEVADELALPLTGLYPITVEVRRDGRRIGARHTTFVERLGTPAAATTGEPTFTLSVLAGIDDPGPTVDESQRLQSRAQLLELAELGESVGPAMTVSVPPGVAELMGTDATAADLAARLTSALAGDEAIALPSIELDPSAAVAAGQAEVFTRTLREGQDILTQALRRTPNARGTWASATAVSEGGAAMLRDLGARLLVVPYDVYVELEGSIPGYTDTSMLAEGLLPDGTTLPVAIVDPVAELLDPERDSARTPAEDAVRLMAELVAMRIQLGPGARNVVLATPTLGIPDGDVLAHVEEFASQDPAMGFRPLSAVPGATDVMHVGDRPLRLTFPDTAGSDLADRVTVVDEMRLYAASTASMLPATDPRRSRWTAELDTLVSTGITDEEAVDVLEALRVELDGIGATIDTPDPFTFTLTGRHSQIRLRFGNTGDTPLLVRVRVSSTKLAFPDDDVEVELAPNAITDVEVDVTALSNGTFPVAVEVFTPLGGAVGQPVPLTARVNAISGLGKVLTGGALLVLLTWWLSHFRRRRRMRLERASTVARRGHPSNGRAVPTILPTSPPTSSPISPPTGPATGAATSDEAATNGSSPAVVPMAEDVSPDAAEAGSGVAGTDVAGRGVAGRGVGSPMAGSGAAGGDPPTPQ
jgi:hypothetical protein